MIFYAAIKALHDWLPCIKWQQNPASFCTLVGSAVEKLLISFILYKTLWSSVSNENDFKHDAVKLSTSISCNNNVKGLLTMCVL